jgi:heme-degrading monooxygenase HmoA
MTRRWEMIAHVATVEGTNAQLDQFVGILREEVAPVLRTRRGFAQSITLIDRDAGRGLLITLWESRAAADASSEQWRKEQATQGASSQVGLRRTAQWYEVAAITGPAERTEIDQS